MWTGSNARIARLGAISCAVAATLGWIAATEDATAGFDWPRQKADGSAIASDNQLEYDGEPLGPAGNPPQDTVDKIIDEFNLMDNADMTAQEQAEAKIAAMRANIVEGIELVAKQNSDVGDCLEELLDDGDICIDFASDGAFGACLPDGVEACNGDQINIRVTDIPCDEVECYNPSIYELYSTLLHEGLHAIQNWNPADEGSADRNRAADIRNNACNERDAEQADVDAICELIDLLMMIEMGNEPATDEPMSMAECIAQKLWDDLVDPDNPDDTAAAEQAAEDLRERIQEVKMERQEVIDTWNVEKSAAQSFLDGDITKMQMDDAVDNAAAIAETIRRLLDALRVAFRYWATSQSGIFHQIALNEDTNQTTTLHIPTSLDAIHDFELLGPDSDKVMIAGRRFGQPTIIGLEDLDNDGFFDPDSEQDLYAGPPFTTSVDIEIEPLELRALTLDRGTGQIFQMIDTNGDGFPDQLLEPVAPPLPPDLHAQTISVPEAGGVIYAHRKHMVRLPAAGFGDPVVALVDGDGDGFYEAPIPIDFFQFSCHPPGIVGPLFPDQPLVPIHGMSNVQVELFVTDNGGNPIQPIAIGATGPDGVGEIPIPPSNPLMPGMPLVPINVEPPKVGALEIVQGFPCPADLTGDGLVNSEDLAQLLGSWGPTSGPSPADFNNDGFVNSVDLAELLGSWGPCP